MIEETKAVEKKTSPSAALGVQPEAEWHVLDAKNKILGRLATQAAALLLGKHRIDFTQRLVAPVYVVVVNAVEVAVSGSKETQKLYRQHSGYPGHLKERTLQQQREKDPRRIIELAVSGMLPKNGLRKQRLNHLKIYAGSEHPHLAQLGNHKSQITNHKL